MSERIKKAIDKSMQFMQGLDRGDLVNHTTLEQVANIKRRTPEWISFTVGLSQRMLAERSIRLVNKHGEGYTLATADDQVNSVCVSDQRKVLRQLRKARQSVEAVPSHELTDHQRRVQAIRAQGIEQLEAEVKRSLKEQQLFARQESLPRPVPA